MKKCSKCQEVKAFDLFAKDSSRTSGYQSRCRACDYESHKAWKLKKYGKPGPIKTKYKSDAERIEAIKINKNKRRRLMSEEQKIKERIARNKRDAIKMNDSTARKKRNIKTIALNGFKKGYSNNAMAFCFYGCSHAELINHIESQFESWMNWDNRGFGIAGRCLKNTYWQLDHIKPLSTATNIEEYILLWNYNNLRPLCAYVNGTRNKSTPTAL